MKVHVLIEMLGSSERARAIGHIANHETPSFIMKHLAEWMTSKSATMGTEWEMEANSLRAKAYELEGRGL